MGSIHSTLVQRFSGNSRHPARSHATNFIQTSLFTLEILQNHRSQTIEWHLPTLVWVCQTETNRILCNMSSCWFGWNMWRGCENGYPSRKWSVLSLFFLGKPLYKMVPHNVHNPVVLALPGRDPSLQHACSQWISSIWNEIAVSPVFAIFCNIPVKKTMKLKHIGNTQTRNSCLTLYHFVGNITLTERNGLTAKWASLYKMLLLTFFVALSIHQIPQWRSILSGTITAPAWTRIFKKFQERRGDGINQLDFWY